MDVERTIEFILRQEARTEGQLAAIRKLIQAGMKLIVKNGEQIGALRESQKELQESQRELQESQRELQESQRELQASHKDVRAELRELAKAQRVTERKLQALFDSWRRGGNGRHGKN